MSLDIKDQRILIVDDAPENVEILGSILSNYKRSVALNGEKALKIAFGENKPDLILLDVIMPGMDGFEVCRKLKENQTTKDIPVIFITAKSEVEDETRGLELGAVDFIPKPISPPVVLARVKNHLELKLARQNLEITNQELAWHNKYITDSINYAKRIQSAILQNEEQLKRIFPESFYIYKPKDIVSGDFYWFAEADNMKIFAAVDCTGHGVPGAFMSIIGNTLLNEIVNVYKVTNPGQILSHLHKRVITELQKEINVQTYDGMDLALGVFDTRKNLLSVAGAYRPIYYVQNNEFHEIKTDRKSIGDPRKDTSFNTYTIKIDSDTEVYVFSDGFTDQNNAEDKKFSASKLKELLSKIHNSSMTEQRQILISEFEKHRGTVTQRDDLLMIGLRLLQLTEVKILSYSGMISHEKIVELGEELNGKFENLITPKQLKTIFFCVNEFLQNILNYSTETATERGRNIRAGYIEVNLIGNSIEIYSGNSASLQSYERIKEKINFYMTLDDEQLKALKKEIVKAETESTSKGGGIGFLEIIRRSKSPITVSYDGTEKQSTIKFFLKINLGDVNG
jgi:CheY-like chemotaxis protein